MKQFLLLICLAVFTGGLSAQVFVNAAAADGGDGTTWATAYNSLSDALAAATSGDEVWVATGTYTTPVDSSFYIDKTLSVLGGFAGTETAADAADPVANVTTLSGDVMGNDGPTYDSTLYADNNRILAVIDTSSTGSMITVTLDGLTFTHGAIAADRGDDDPSLRPFAGGGIFATGKVAGSRLNFSANRANYGSAISVITGNANGSTFDDITIADNFVDLFNHIYINSSDDIGISNSTFTDNPNVTVPSGFIYGAFVDRITIENSSFENLTTSDQGGAVFLVQSDDMLVTNCTFNNLFSTGGGAFYTQQGVNFVPTSEVMDENDFVIDGSTLTNCETSGRGGIVRAFNTNIKITNSMVADNSAASIGGAVYQVAIDERDYETVFTDTDFLRSTDGGAGGAFCLLVVAEVTGGPILADVVGTVTGCTFSENVSNGRGSGGAFYLQDNNNFTFNDSDFNENIAGAGTILTSGINGLTLNNCNFTDNGDNVDAYRGGAIAGFFDDNAPGLMIDSSTFVGNSVTDRDGSFSGGGVLYMLGGSNKTIPLTITNSLFSGNGANAEQSGGALLLLRGIALSIDNSEFIDNSADGDGGAINAQIFVTSRDTTDGVITVTFDPWDADVRNSKFINSSSGSQGGAISTQRVGMDFTNCVFVNNIVGGAGSGGAIIFNGNAPGLNEDGSVAATGAVQINAAFVNNTFVDNAKGDGEGAVGASLALFQPGDTESADSNSMMITLTNNAFLSTTNDPGIEVELGANEPGGFVSVGNLFFESLGGNYFNAENGPEVELGDNGDIINEDLTDDQVTELFVDILNDNDEGTNAQLAVLGDLGAGNPLINLGVSNGLTPDVDLAGNPRGDAPDIGAYEADQGAVDTNEPVENSGLDLTFFPNPTMGELNIQNNDASITDFEVVVSDQAGRILQAARFFGASNRMDFSNLPMGVYNLQLYVNGNVYSKQIVKQ